MNPNLLEKVIRAPKEIKVNVLGIGISNLTTEQLNEEILKIITDNKKELVLNVNIHCINLAFEHGWLKKMLNTSKIVFCDGEGVRLGAKLTGKKIKEKITYNRWVWSFAEYSEKNNLSWYLIGSKEPVILKAVQELQSAFPDLEIKGFRNGFFKDQSEINETIIDINNKSVNVLILGMGMPLQEKWLLDNWKDVNANVALTGGAVFDYVSGSAKMTPNIIYKLKLEWFYRFIQEPRRLFKRYIIGNPLFFIRLFAFTIRKRFNY